jgi:hypothetical protein
MPRINKKNNPLNKERENYLFIDKCQPYRIPVFTGMTSKGVVRTRSLNLKGGSLRKKYADFSGGTLPYFPRISEYGGCFRRK